MRECTVHLREFRHLRRRMPNAVVLCRAICERRARALPPGLAVSASLCRLCHPRLLQLRCSKCVGLTVPQPCRCARPNGQAGSWSHARNSRRPPPAAVLQVSRRVQAVAGRAPTAADRGGHAGRVRGVSCPRCPRCAASMSEVCHVRGLPCSSPRPWAIQSPGLTAAPLGAKSEPTLDDGGGSNHISKDTPSHTTLPCTLAHHTSSHPCTPHSLARRTPSHTTLPCPLAHHTSSHPRTPHSLARRTPSHTPLPRTPLPRTPLRARHPSHAGKSHSPSHAQPGEGRGASLETSGGNGHLLGFDPLPHPVGGGIVLGLQWAAVATGLLQPL